MLHWTQEPTRVAQGAVCEAQMLELDDLPFTDGDTIVKTYDVAGTTTIDAAATWNLSAVATDSYMQSDGKTVGASAQVTLLPTATGSGYGQTTSRNYLVRKISIRGSIRCASNTSTTPNYVRVALVEDTQPTGSAPVANDVFSDWGNSEQLMWSFPAEAAGAGGRFRILKSVLLRQDPSDLRPDGLAQCWTGSEIRIDFKPVRPREVWLKAGGSTPNVANLSNRNIFLVMHSSIITGVIAVWTSRCWYID